MTVSEMLEITLQAEFVGQYPSAAFKAAFGAVFEQSIIYISNQDVSRKQYSKYPVYMFA